MLKNGKFYGKVRLIVLGMMVTVLVPNIAGCTGEKEAKNVQTEKTEEIKEEPDWVKERQEGSKVTSEKVSDTEVLDWIDQKTQEQNTILNQENMNKVGDTVDSAANTAIRFVVDWINIIFCDKEITLDDGRTTTFKEHSKEVANHAKDKLAELWVKSQAKYPDFTKAVLEEVQLTTERLAELKIFIGSKISQESKDNSQSIMEGVKGLGGTLKDHIANGWHTTSDTIEEALDQYEEEQKQR